MKSILIALLLLLLLPFANAQTPDWQAHLVVEQPWNGNTDTIIIGLDYDAMDGYDPAWDAIDTSFQYPLAMRSRITEVESDSGFCAANMKTNIKAFAPIVTWDIYIKADTFQPAPDHELPIDSIALFKWDTAEWHYEDEFYKRDYAFIYTTTAYINAIDLQEACLNIGSGSCHGVHGAYYDKAQLYYIFGIWPDEYLFGDCATEENIFKLTLQLELTDLLPVENYEENSFTVSNNINTNTLHLKFTDEGEKTLRIYDLAGQHIKSINSIYENTYTLNYSTLPPGFYILQYYSPGKHIEIYKFIKP